MKTLAIFALMIAAACGTDPLPQATLNIALVAKEKLIEFEHPDSDSYFIEVTERNVVVWESEGAREAIDSVAVLGHLAVDGVLLQDANGNAPAPIMNESCSRDCVCPQSPTNWWEKEFLVVSAEMREAFGDHIAQNETIASVCETPTSRRWSQDAPAFQ